MSEILLSLAHSIVSLYFQVLVILNFQQFKSDCQQDMYLSNSPFLNFLGFSMFYLTIQSFLLLITDILQYSTILNCQKINYFVIKIHKIQKWDDHHFTIRQMIKFLINQNFRNILIWKIYNLIFFENWS